MGVGTLVHGFGLPGSYAWLVIIKLIAIKNLLISSIPKLALTANSSCLSGRLSCNSIFVKSSKEEIRTWVSQSEKKKKKRPSAECCSLLWTNPKEGSYHRACAGLPPGEADERGDRLINYGAPQWQL